MSQVGVVSPQFLDSEPNQISPNFLPEKCKNLPFSPNHRYVLMGCLTPCVKDK